MHQILETPRLQLKQFSNTDARLLLELNSLPEVVKYVHEPTLKTLEEAQNILDNIILPQYKNKLGRWAIYLKSNNEFIGWCGLKYIVENNEIDLGYRLMPQFWGKGYAYEAAKYCMDYGFNQLHLENIIGRAHCENTASLKILEKLGMQFLKEENAAEGIIRIYSLSKYLLPKLC